MNASVGSPVLIIDDSLTIRKLLEMALQRAGHAYEVAALGRDGIALARRLRPKLVLLDYVLPDIKGNEVCTELANDPLTAGVPVVIMSGKGDDIRPLFRHQRSVVDFIAKPFSPAEIMHVMQRALSAGGPLPAPGEESSAAHTAVIDPPTASFSQPREAKEAAAKVLFSAMRDRLARIPEWLAESAGQSPAPFFARRILTPDVVSAVLQGLAAQTPAPATTAPDASEFSGNTGFIPLFSLLRLVAESHRAGELRLGGSNGLSVYCERGLVVLAAPRDPGSARRVLSDIGHSEDPARIVAWDQAARSGGVPPAIAAASGTGASGAEILARLSRQALVQLANQGPVPFSWHDLPSLPPAVSELATLTPPLALGQLALDRLRQVDDWSQVELEVRSLTQICARAPDFAARLPEFSLTPAETAVLLQVDGRRSVKDILDRSGLSTFDVFHILYRLLHVRLITLPDETNAHASVVLVDSDTHEIAAPLANWLEQRSEALTLVHTQPDRLLAEIRATIPRLALIDVEATANSTTNLPQTLRRELATSAVPLVALVNWADRNRRTSLLAAGWDHILIKPIHLNAIGRLLDRRRAS